MPHPLPSYLYRPRTLLRRQPHRNLYNCSALSGWRPIPLRPPNARPAQPPPRLPGLNDEKSVRLEMHCDGVLPVHVTLVGATFNIPTISRFIRELVAALAPGRGSERRPGEPVG